MTMGRIVSIALSCALLSGCIATALTDVDVEPGFDWDSLKRDQIVMTPLLDLRGDKAAPSGQQKLLDFFDDSDRLAYPEKFKQEFFELRKDIRVFGAGGAYDHIAKVDDLAKVATKVFAKEALGDADMSRLTSGMQGIRFLFFFAMTAESLQYGFDYDFRQDQEMDVKAYTSTRHMTLRLALWDSQANKTVWIGTQRLSPSHSETFEVRNPTKRKKKEGNMVVWVGQPEHTSLTEELARNRGRFPGFPGREPSFSGAFDDFALGLPIQPSEAKLIEYEHFTYHRPELSVRTSAFGSDIVPSLQLGTSSVINYNLRFGGGLVVPLGSSDVALDGKEFALSSMSYGLTFDYEWTLSERVRLLTGAMFGGTTFIVDELNLEPVAEGEEQEDASISDGALHLWPRVFVLFGAKGDFQWGVGGAGRFFDGIEEPVVKAKRPSPWSLDLSVAYAFRGF